MKHTTKNKRRTLKNKTNLDFKNLHKENPSNSNVRKFVKIQNGCDHSCTFCIIPSLRGPLKSRSMNSIVSEAKSLVERGTKELLVISQDTSAYGLDLKFEEVSVNGKKPSDAQTKELFLKYIFLFLMGINKQNPHHSHYTNHSLIHN